MEQFRGGNAWIFLLIFGMVVISCTGCGEKKEAAKATGPGIASEETSRKEEMPVPSTLPITEERIFYDYETANLNGWEIPSWAEGKTDHVAREAIQSTEFASHGASSMKIIADFPLGIWSAALVEIQQYLDLSRWRVVMADVYLPENAPIGLRAKFILTVGDTWKFVEMNQSIPLMPGEWGTITANIEPGSYDWKRVIPDKNFAEDVRKIAVRIECNRKPAYAGAVYLDNVRVGR